MLSMSPMACSSFYKLSSIMVPVMKPEAGIISASYSASLCVQLPPAPRKDIIGCFLVALINSFRIKLAIHDYVWGN